MTWINWYGLEFVSAIMIPNIAFAMTHRDGFENLFRNRTVEVLEQIGRFGCFFLMVIQPETLCRDDWFTGATQVYLWLGAALVLLYCAGWVVFWREDSVRKALALSILPSVLFLESGILRCYFPLIAAALLFAPCHILISYKNAAMKREIALNGEAPEQSVKDRQ